MQRFRLVSSLVAALLGACAPATEPPVQTGFRAVQFPASFRWGTATAQWQVEGDQGVNGPVASNWSAWMTKGRGIDGQTNPSGNGFFEAYEDDIARAADLGLDSFRLSIDWSRVEPQQGVFDDAELDHLVDVLDAVRAAGLEPVLTLYHWTVPLWVQDPDGPDLIAGEDDAVVDLWEDFVRRVIPRVADRVDTYTVLNEPFSMITAGYIGGSFPPGGFIAVDAAKRFGVNLIRMHARAYDVIKELDTADADADGAASWVGTTMSSNGIYPEHPGDPDEEFAATHLSYVYNDWVMNALTTGELDLNLDEDSDDEGEGVHDELADRLEFVGVQYYGPVIVRAHPLFVDLDPLYGLPLLDVDDYDPLLPHNGMGREISAAGFRDTIEIYARHGVPMIITENGTTRNLRPVEGQPLAYDDAQAAMYVVEHLWELGRAIERGVDVRGYYHWTLADNYEWVEGHHQRFGAYAVDVDDEALPRTLTPMGQALQDVVAAGGIDEALWDLWVLPCYPTDAREDCGPTTSEPQVGTLSSPQD